MKKILALLLSMCFSFGAMACVMPQGGSSEESISQSEEMKSSIESILESFEEESEENSESTAEEESEEDGESTAEEEEGTQILVVEKYEGESASFIQTISAEEYEIDCKNIGDETLPVTEEALARYEEVVLYNIANADMPEGFAEVLYTYVNERGGGLFTVGGNRLDENGNVMYDADNYNQIVPNAYNRFDLRETLYREMLPVQPINYTPPVATMILIDRSSSMSMVTDSGITMLEAVKQGARAYLNELTERDYCGVMTLGDSCEEVCNVSPISSISSLQLAIDSITIGGTTVFEDALRGAAKALQAVPKAEKRHVVLLTDGAPSDSFEVYKNVIVDYANDAKKPVTFSFFSIGKSMTALEEEELMRAAELGNGRFYSSINEVALTSSVREDICRAEFKAVEYRQFTPQAVAQNDIFFGLTQEELSALPSLSGFYGAKVKEGAELVLQGENVPIYAYWQFGEGKVGSFMCDLNGVWSAEFMFNEVGKTIIKNMINCLMRK